MGSVAFAMAVAAPAWATTSAAGTLAPIGSGSYLLTVTNTGSEAITGFVVEPGEEPVPTNVVPSPACKYGSTPVTGSITCNVALAPGASTQMCYTGHALGELFPGSSGLILGGSNGYFNISASPAVASCPVPGFNAGSGSTPTTGGKPAPAWSRAQCKSTYKAWSKKHRHANHAQKKTEASKLHKTHGCPLSILK